MHYGLIVIIYDLLTRSLSDLDRNLSHSKTHLFKPIELLTDTFNTLSTK